MIYLQNLHKQFGPKIILKNVNFHLRPGERVGLVGENGTGKTTLFRIIMKTESSDSGKIIFRKGAQAATLEQELNAYNGSVLERVISGDHSLQVIRRKMDDLEKQISSDPTSEAATSHYGKLQHQFEQLNGYELEPRASTILSGLGFSDDKFKKPLNEFSGGWRMRVEMARLLLQNPDILLLDEPTNHFDLKSVEWLEGFLKNYDGSLLLISHDRRFLNNLVTRIIELDRGILTAYSGNYNDFERLKKEREAQLLSESVNQQKRITEIERFIERFRAKNTKATQVQSRIKMLNKMERIETMTDTKTVGFRFPQPVRTGRISMELDKIDKSYGDNIVYQNFSIRIERGWKVALVGENGAGKSTLMKLLAGIISHDRYFLDGFINRVWEVKQGSVSEYIGNYSEYENSKTQELEIESSNSTVSIRKPSASYFQKNHERKRLEAENRNIKHQTLKPLRSNLKKIEIQLERVLTEKTIIENKLANSVIYEPRNKAQLLETLSSQTELANDEKNLTEEWNSLSSQIEKYESSSTPKN